MDFFDFLGLFSKSFSLETIDFCEKSFCIAVSRYNIFHMTHMTHTFVKKAASLMFHNVEYTLKAIHHFQTFPSSFSNRIFKGEFYSKTFSQNIDFISD